jgi:hypothetical protein
MVAQPFRPAPIGQDDDSPQHKERAMRRTALALALAAFLLGACSSGNVEDANDALDEVQSEAGEVIEDNS